MVPHERRVRRWSPWPLTLAGLLRCWRIRQPSPALPPQPTGGAFLAQKAGRPPAPPPLVVAFAPQGRLFEIGLSPDQWNEPEAHLLSVIRVARQVPLKHGLFVAGASNQERHARQVKA